MLTWWFGSRWRSWPGATTCTYFWFLFFFSLSPHPLSILFLLLPPSPYIYIFYPLAASPSFPFFSIKPCRCCRVLTTWAPSSSFNLLNYTCPTFFSNPGSVILAPDPAFLFFFFPPTCSPLLQDGKGITLIRVRDLSSWFFFFLLPSFSSIPFDSTTFFSLFKGMKRDKVETVSEACQWGERKRISFTSTINKRRP